MAIVVDSVCEKPRRKDRKICVLEKTADHYEKVKENYYQE